MEMMDVDLGWHRVNATRLTAIRQRLASLETMTWAEILIKSKKQNHSIEISALSQSARLNLERRRLLLEDVISLRLTGEERIFGYLDNGTMILLWWDPDHKVCPANLKHT